mgnify:CR=1 FL=1
MGGYFTVEDTDETYNTHDNRSNNFGFDSSGYRSESSAGDESYSSSQEQEYTSTRQTGEDGSPALTETLEGVFNVERGALFGSTGSTSWNLSRTGSQDGFNAGWGETYSVVGSWSSTHDSSGVTNFANGDSTAFNDTGDQSSSVDSSSYYNSGISVNDTGGNWTEDNNGVTTEFPWTVDRTHSGGLVTTFWDATYYGTTYNLDDENVTWEEATTLALATSSSWFTSMKNSIRYTSVESYEQITTLSTMMLRPEPVQDVLSWTDQLSTTHQNTETVADAPLGAAYADKSVLLPFNNYHDEGNAYRYAVGNTSAGLVFSRAKDAGSIASDNGDEWYNGTTVSYSMRDEIVSGLTDTEFGGSVYTITINEGAVLTYHSVSEGELVEVSSTVEAETATAWDRDGYPENVEYYDTTGFGATTTDSTFIVADGETENSSLINQTTVGKAVTNVASVIQATTAVYALWGGNFSGESSTEWTASNASTFAYNGPDTVDPTDTQDYGRAAGATNGNGGTTFAITSSNSFAGANGEQWTNWESVGHYEENVWGPVAVSGRAAMGYLPFYYSTGDLKTLYASDSTTLISSEVFGDSISLTDLDESALTHAQSGMRGRGRTGLDMDMRCNTLTTTAQGTEIITVPSYTSVEDTITNTYSILTDTRAASERYGSNSIDEVWETTETTGTIGSYESTEVTAYATHTHSYTAKWLTPPVSARADSSRELAWTFRDHHLQSIKGRHRFSLHGDIDPAGSYWRHASMDRTFANGDHENTLNFGGCGLIYTIYESDGSSESSAVSASEHGSISLSPRACIGWEVEPILANVANQAPEQFTHVLQDAGDNNVYDFSVAITTLDE